MTEKFLYERNLSKKADLNFWLAFPAIYSFGMASLGFLSIFETLDKMDNVKAERIFSDTKKTEINISDVDAISFSFSFEFDFIGIFQLMEQHNIPFLSSERNESMPLICGGGPVLSSNPEPFSPFFDFIMVGDAENVIEKVAQTIIKYKNRPKKEVLIELSKIPSIYVPSFTEFDLENKLLIIDKKPFSIEKNTFYLSRCISTPILTEESYFSNTFVIEIARGCNNRCGFCNASYLNLPARFCSYEEITGKIENALKYTNKIAFLGALISAHPDFERICNYVINKIDSGVNIELSISSIRLNHITPKAVEMLVKGGQKHATVALEAGSERLRRVINKNLTEKQILNAVKVAYENGLKGFKVYAMIGLPTETYEDLDQIVELARRIKKEYKKFDLTFSFSTFVPKAQTPFQYASREDTKSLEKKYSYLKKEFHKSGIKIRCSSVKWDYYQAVFSRGDRRLAEYAIEVYKQGSNIGAFKNVYKNMQKTGKLPSSDSFALDNIDLNSNLVWNFINLHNDKKALELEYKRLVT